MRIRHFEALVALHVISGHCRGARRSRLLVALQGRCRRGPDRRGRLLGNTRRFVPFVAIAAVAHQSIQNVGAIERHGPVALLGADPAPGAALIIEVPRGRIEPDPNGALGSGGTGVPEIVAKISVSDIEGSGMVSLLERLTRNIVATVKLALRHPITR